MISMPRDTTTPDVWLGRIAVAVRLSTRRSVNGVYPPNAPLLDRKVTLEANAEPARDVLDRLLAALPRQGAWTVSYVPASERFFIGIRYLPGAAP
jgi:hypothetical protein